MSNASKYDLLKLLRTRSDITVKTLSDLHAIKAYKRKWMISVGVYDDPDDINNGLYMLIKGESSDDIKDNNNWVKYSDATGGDGPWDFSKNYQIYAPDVNIVRIGDVWTNPVSLKEYRLVEQDGERWWVETTSPRLIPAKLFDHTFDKSFN